MKMIKCEECDKKLGIFQAYYHPALGKKHTVCNNCCDKVSDSLQKWTDFILPYADFFQKTTKDNNLDSNWKNIHFGSIELQKIINDKWTGKKIL